MRARRILTALILFMSFQGVFAQENKWYIDGAAKLSLLNFNGAGFNSVEAYSSSAQEYYFVDENDMGANFSYLVFYELAGGYKFNTWLKGQLSIAYAPENEVGSGTRPAGNGLNIGFGSYISSSYTVKNQGWEVVPVLRFDVLADSEFEAFSFHLGAGYGRIDRTSLLSANGSDEMDNSVNQTLNWTRRIEYLKLNLGIEWRDYFSQHFGYFLRLHTYPGLFTTTAGIDVQNFRVDGTVQPLQGKEIEPGSNDAPEEPHQLFLMEVALGLTYQF